MDYDRPFLSYDEQIKKLINDYGLIIEDIDFAKKLLSTISYYDLINGYQELFSIEENIKYNIPIEFLYSIYIFDKDFQNILLKYSLYAENSFKTSLAYVLAEEFGVHVDEYLNIEKYTKNENGKIITILNNIKKNYNSKYVQDPTKHYKKTKNHTPPWILLKNCGFHDAQSLYSILKTTEKNKIISQYSTLQAISLDKQNRIFETALNIVRNYRNIMSHNLKFVTYKPQKSFNFKDIMDIENISTIISWRDIKKKKLGNKDVYSLILALIILVDDNHILIRLVQELYAFINMNKNILDNQDLIFYKYCEISNLPKDIDNRLLKLFEKLK